MRPRKTTFGTMPYKELQKFLNDNDIWGHTVHEDPDFLTYTYLVMFRRNKEAPEELYVKVSRRSKLVIHLASNKRTFLSLTDAIDKLKKQQS